MADFFEKFPQTCLEFYSLDPLHYYTTPGLAWDAALRMSHVDLPLITDRISMISTRHAQANNPSFTDTYDDNLPNQNLIYLDANNLHGWGMSQFLPTHGFRFLSKDGITTLKLEDLCDDDEDGYIYEVDLHYPTKLYNLHHDDYPLAPESLVIDRLMYWPTQQSMSPESAPQKKLTPNLRDKVKYVVHSRNLKIYIQLGLVVTEVHRVPTFKHTPWLKTYIDFNTHRRSLSDNGFLKDFFILMNNCVFGKTQENLRQRVQVDLYTDANTLRKRVAKPSFCRGILITDCLTVVQCTVQTLTLNRPIYVGFTVLELSKLHMYNLHYNHMKVKYPHASQLRLLFTDTNSLAYAVKTENIYEDMASDAAIKYDFSEYPRNHPLYNTSNRKALGFVKDELNSIPMKEFVGLRPKCLCFSMHRQSGWKCTTTF